MTTRARLLGGAIAVAASIAAFAARAEVTGSPIAAACYATARGCRVELDPFALDVPMGRRLEHVSIDLNGQTVYDFATDQSNPPGSGYVPSAPARGLAARCEQSYVVTVRAMDDLDPSPVLVGQTDAVPCPVRVPEPGAGLAALAGAAVLLDRSRRLATRSGVARRARPRG